MGLSEHDAEERLTQLRRQREALDREIADLVLYLELGRRLKAGAPRPAMPDPRPMADHPPSVPEPWPEPRPEPEAVPTVASPPPRPKRPSAPEPVAFAEDPTGARRYGRALVEAACAILAAAGQPLHAREIHDGLIAGASPFRGATRWRPSTPGSGNARAKAAPCAAMAMPSTAWQRNRGFQKG